MLHEVKEWWPQTNLRCSQRHPYPRKHLTGRKHFTDQGGMCSQNLELDLDMDKYVSWGASGPWTAADFSDIMLDKNKQDPSHLFILCVPEDEITLPQLNSMKTNQWQFNTHPEYTWSDLMKESEQCLMDIMCFTMSVVTNVQTDRICRLDSHLHWFWGNFEEWQ